MSPYKDTHQPNSTHDGLLIHVGSYKMKKQATVSLTPEGTEQMNDGRSSD